MLQKVVFTAALLLASSIQPAAATRADGTPICDYYAKELYGDNTKSNQLKLMTSIVAFAYAGGEKLKNADKNSTGIFNVGSLDSKALYLRPYFDGTMNTTNLNDQAVALNWLDGGGVDPLRAFINGTKDTADIKKGTNQYTLFTHWYVAFGRIYGCSEVENFLDQKYRTLMPAYVHKYMDLDKAKIAYFIRQLILASKYYGFTEQDANTLEQYMNNRYNIRCAPVDKNMLNSICFAKDCPLALPKSDCDAYKEIKPYGVSDDASATPSATGTSPAAPTNTGGSDSGKSDLGTGAIVGIAVGAAAGIGLVIGALWFWFKKRASRRDDAKQPDGSVASPNPGGYNGSMYSPAMTQGTPGPYDAGSQGQYDPNRQSQFTYFSNTQDSFGQGGSPPAMHGWTELPPQELHATEISGAPGSSPSPGSLSGSQFKSGYKPDLRELVEMESPPPAHPNGAQGTPQDGQTPTPK
ncbi:hypothetical protein NHJ13734_004113 [Beauveria thailandica]